MHAVDIAKWAVEVGERGRYSLVDTRLTDTDIYERMNEMEMQEMFDRDGEFVTVKSWIKEGINWHVGDVSAPETISELRRNYRFSCLCL